MNLDNDLNFLYEIWTLRHVQRTWIEFMWNNMANVAEHTLRVIWTALIIAKNENVSDTAKVIKMCLAHDIPEIRSCDTHYLSRSYVKRFEEDAMKDTLEWVSIWDDFYEIFEEYSKQWCIEAKIAKDADNLDVDLELMEEFYKWSKIAEIFQKKRPEMKNKYNTETAKKMFDLIQNSNPHEWHLQWKNRFNNTDWNDKK